MWEGPNDVVLCREKPRRPTLLHLILPLSHALRAAIPTARTDRLCLILWDYHLFPPWGKCQDPVTDKGKKKAREEVPRSHLWYATSSPPVVYIIGRPKTLLFQRSWRLLPACWKLFSIHISWLRMIINISWPPCLQARSKTESIQKVGSWLWGQVVGLIRDLSRVNFPVPQTHVES